MDKNTITGFALIALILIGFGWWQQPSDEEIAEMARQDSIQKVKTLAAEKKEAKAAQEKAVKLAQQANDSTALFYEARNKKGEQVKLTNGLIDLTLNTRGGSIESATLTKYKNQQGGDVQLLQKNQNSLSYSFVGKEDNLDTRDFTFEAVNKTDSTVTMRLSDGKSTMNIDYALHAGSYLTDITITTVNMGKVLHPSNKTVNILWDDLAAQQEKGFDFEQRYSSLTYREQNGDIEEVSATSDKEEKPEDPISWIAFKNQFFSCVLITDKDFTDATLHSIPQEKGAGYLKEYTAQMNAPFDLSGKTATKMQMYIGPNDFHLLQSQDNLCIAGKDADLEELVDLGWPLFRYINRWIILPLFDFLTGFGLSMGIVLLLLTLIVKALVYPTTKKSYLSSARMRVLKPKVDALNLKYPNREDAMKKQGEMMQLYKEYGVSPMGGCLPMLIQMPIWIALFNFVPNAIELRGQSFLWAKDLSSYDELLHWNADIWLIGDHLSIFCLLFCLTNIINAWISMRQQQDQMSSEQAQQMKMMQYMMFLMPIMFFFMFNNYSSGLCYYYFLSGLTSIIIMWYLRKTTDDAKLLAKLEAYREQHKNDPKKVSGMAARLEALQKMQEQQMKNKK